VPVSISFNNLSYLRLWLLQRSSANSSGSSFLSSVKLNLNRLEVSFRFSGNLALTVIDHPKTEEKARYRSVSNSDFSSIKLNFQ